MAHNVLRVYEVPKAFVQAKQTANILLGEASQTNQP